MRRLVTVVIAASAVAALVASLAARGSASARSGGCTAKPAHAYDRHDAHSLDLSIQGLVVDSFVDAQGHRLHQVGGGTFIAPFAGWNENSFINGSGGTSSDIMIDSGNPNAYAVSGHSGKIALSEIRVRRYTQSVQLDGVATWVVPTVRATGWALAYANGQPLGSLRLCLDRGRDGSVDMTRPPDGVVQGAAAADMAAPLISGRVLSTASGESTVELFAKDTASGTAGIWWGVEGGGYRGRYAKPVRVPADATLGVYAIDRAGNMSSAELRVATLPRG